MAEVREERSLPVAVVEKAALAVLAAAFDGRALPIARSIYLAVVEHAGESLSRAALADVAGVSKKSLAEYTPQLEATGLLIVERHEDDRGVKLPSTWRLVSRGVGTLPDVGTPGAHPSSSSPSTKGEEDGGVGTERAHPVKEPLEGALAGVPPGMVADVEELLRAKRRVDGKLVTPVEMCRAARALAAFNAAQGADHGLGANLPKLVGRIRERPSWDADKLVRLVESAWRLKWWERNGRAGRRPTPAVVFGNSNVFEQVAHDAALEAAGRPIEDTPQRRSRFERTAETV